MHISFKLFYICPPSGEKCFKNMLETPKTRYSLEWVFNSIFSYQIAIQCLTDIKWKIFAAFWCFYICSGSAPQFYFCYKEFSKSIIKHFIVFSLFIYLYFRQDENVCHSSSGKHLSLFDNTCVFSFCLTMCGSSLTEDKQPTGGFTTSRASLSCTNVCPPLSLLM